MLPNDMKEAILDLISVLPQEHSPSLFYRSLIVAMADGEAQAQDGYTYCPEISMDIVGVSGRGICIVSLQWLMLSRVYSNYQKGDKKGVNGSTPKIMLDAFLGPLRS